METQTYSYRVMLADQYLLRKGRNTQYSKAAFSRDLGLAQPKLTQILNGTSGISPKRAIEVANRLEMPEEEEELFLTLVEVEHARSPMVKKRAEKRLKIFTEDSSQREKVTAIKLFRKWTHVAVLNLLSKNDEIAPQSLAVKLGLKVSEIDQSLAILKDLKLITQNKKGYLSSSDKLISSFDIPSQVIRDYHAQYLDKAQEALKTIPIDQREFISLSFKIRLEDIPKIKNEIRKFIKSLDRKFTQKDYENTELYQTMLQLYPITKIKNKEKKI